MAPGVEHIFHQYTLRAPKRDELAAFLKEKGIPHAIYYPVPLHLQKAFAMSGGKKGDFPVTETGGRRSALAADAHGTDRRSSCSSSPVPSREFYAVRLNSTLGATLVVIPTYNEAENIPRLDPAGARAGPRLDVLVVDDGSPDGTGDAGEGHGAEETRGSISSNVRARWAWEPRTLPDSGMRSRTGTISCLKWTRTSPTARRRSRISCRRSGEADLVIGSRYTNGVRVLNWPMQRLLLSYSANVYTRFMTGLPLHDATGGFKCYRIAGAGGDRSRPDPVERLCVPDRNELQGLEERVPSCGNSDRVSRPAVREIEDVETDRLRGVLHALETPVPQSDQQAVRPPWISPSSSSTTTSGSSSRMR